MDSAERNSLLQQLDGSGSDLEWTAVYKLRELGSEFATLLRERYRSTKTWKARAGCLFHAARYARVSEDAFQLGVEALSDKSKPVRYQAALLLAYSQREDALPALRAAVSKVESDTGAADLRAAIDAIESRNHHYFVDRNHTGKITLTIE
ncbi:MAG: hypothetical protein IPK82_25445 [Polyangiaceae bacterium]|nr:hypothetical protein [Polyangiaceae bacterium]